MNRLVDAKLIEKDENDEEKEKKVKTHDMVNEFPLPESYKKNWKGACPYPKYIREEVQRQKWFPR